MFVRGREGLWAWILHRITGLGVLLFLFLHIVDTSLLLAGPASYNHLIKTVYQAWWFQPMEIALGAALLYHTLNGLRVILLDFWEQGITHDRLLRRLVVGTFVVVLVPMAVVMLWPFVFSPGTAAAP
jgi:succinate dehydrogenase / fumarate reductase cytochrome b subunit